MKKLLTGLMAVVMMAGLAGCGSKDDGAGAVSYTHLASRMSMESAQEIAAHVYGVAKEGVRLLPEALEPAQEKQAAEPVTPQGAIPEGTVIGDGHIKYVLARIDSRLLHGQVATCLLYTSVFCGQGRKIKI